MSVIYDLCVMQYEQGGQSAVFNFVSNNFPELQWQKCEPCESVSPIEDNACLVCGTTIKESNKPLCGDHLVPVKDCGCLG